MRRFVLIAGWDRRALAAAVGLALWIVLAAGEARAQPAPAGDPKDAKSEAAQRVLRALQGKQDAEAQRVQELARSIHWQKGPAVGKLGTIAEIQIPDGYQFTDQQGAAAWAELTQNIANPNRLGVLMPSSQEQDWFIVFTYDDSGHVKDEEKSKLDAASILASLREGNDEANKLRRSKGWPELAILGWIEPPAYEETTQHLVWAIRGKSEGGEVANYNTRILGRTGVMSANLVVDPQQMNRVLADSKKLLEGFTFGSGNKYAEWRPGDKLAAYGLTGLITGAAAVGAAKTGLLAKLAVVFAKAGKAIVIALAALAAGVWKFCTSFFRKRAER
jgi:uncharacterized membrane-anchored protein